MVMPAGSMGESGRFARALSAEIRASIARQRTTNKQVAIDAGLSANYVGKRLRDEAPFTLNDVEAVCAALGEDLEEVIHAAVRAMRDQK